MVADLNLDLYYSRTGGVEIMIKSVEAIIEADGEIRLREIVHLPHACRAIVTIIEAPDIPETALLSETALGEDWNRPEEENAWSHLQQVR